MPAGDGTGRGWYRHDMHWFEGNNGRTYLRFTYPNAKPYYVDQGLVEHWTAEDGGWKYSGPAVPKKRLSDEDAAAAGLPALPAWTEGPPPPPLLKRVAQACRRSHRTVSMFGMAAVSFAAGVVFGRRPWTHAS